MRIDIHTHIIPEHLPRWSEKFGYNGFIHLDHHKPCCARMMKDDEFFREIQSNCWDPEKRIEECNHTHVDVQVLSTIPIMFNYWAKPQDCLEISRFLNLDERAFFPIYEAAEELGLALFVHPWNMMGARQMSKYWLPWLVGMPAETNRAICSLIFGGVFERFPKLRFAFAHGGGSFPANIGRIERGFNVRPDLTAIDNQVNPRDYLGHFYVDSLIHDEAFLKYVINLLGEDRVCIGSDYPFPLGEDRPGEEIEALKLPKKTNDKLMYKNALEWLQLDKKKFIT